MIRLILLSLLQSLLLALGQVFMKFATQWEGRFEWSWRVFTNWWLLAAGGAMFAATVLWMYLLKNHDLSVVHPLSAASFIFSMVLAWIFFGENIPLIRILGVALIIGGMYFVSRSAL